MKRLLALTVAALTLMGCRELTYPKQGFIIVPGISSPVRVITKDLEGSGWIKAFTTNGEWEVIYEEPGGSFFFNDVLPLRAWHCEPSNGSEGCVAILQAGDETGYLNAGYRPYGKFHVCTENYVQKVGRKHCGERKLERFTFFGGADDTDEVPLPRDRTKIPLADEYPTPGGLYSWHGDGWSRFVTGSASFPDIHSWHPPAEGEPTSTWYERPYDPYTTLFAGSSYPTVNMSYDIGACSIFFPWEWDDRLQSSFWTAAIGVQTGNRGLAEILLDGIIESAAPQTSLVRDAFLYMDALGNVLPRTDVSPEFHFKVANDAWGSDGELEPQICLKNYFTASNSISPEVEEWYRWDQGILSGFTSLFGIGSCKHHPFSVMYCGAIDLDSQGRGRFRISPDVNISMEGYSVFKPACNNRFIPEFKEAMKNGIRTVGQQNLSDGIADLVDGLRENLGIMVRGLQATPTGVYIITAGSIEDVQYGIGNCLPDLERQDTTPTVQPGLTKEYTTRGVTRF
jgi:hypothetical protein